jgi:hypothetical protein
VALRRKLSGDSAALPLPRPWVCRPYGAAYGTRPSMCGRPCASRGLPLRGLEALLGEVALFGCVVWVRRPCSDACAWHRTCAARAAAAGPAKAVACARGPCGSAFARVRRTCLDWSGCACASEVQCLGGRLAGSGLPRLAWGPTSSLPRGRLFGSGMAARGQHGGEQAVGQVPSVQHRACRGPLPRVPRQCAGKLGRQNISVS